MQVDAVAIVTQPNDLLPIAILNNAVRLTPQRPVLHRNAPQQHQERLVISPNYLGTTLPNVARETTVGERQGTCGNVIFTFFLAQKN